MSANQVIRPGGEGLKQTFPGGAIPLSTTYRVTGSSGAAAALTLDADTSGGNIVYQIFGSYSAAPQAGAYLQIDDGTNVFFKQYVAQTGNVFTIIPPRIGAKNAQTVITLSAGGGSVVAELAVTTAVME